MTACFGPGDRVRFAGGVGTVAYVEGIGVYVWPDAEQGSKPDRFSIDELTSASPAGLTKAETMAMVKREAEAFMDSGPFFGVNRSAANTDPTWRVNTLTQEQAAEVLRLMHDHAAWEDRYDTTAVQAKLDGASRRANELSDRCGALETEKRDLLCENATLRRRVEVLERDAKRGRR